MTFSRRDRTAAARLALLVPALALVSATCTTDDTADLAPDPPPLVPDAPGPPEDPDAPGPPVRLEAAPPPGEPPPAADAQAAIERDLFERLNDERVARGHRPLEWDDRLADLALEWSAELAETGRFEHRDLDDALFGGRLDGFVGVGENLFGATGPLPAGHAHVGWMQSPSHRANLLAPGWERVGIGVVCTADRHVVATQNFGRVSPGGAVPDAADPPPEEPIARPTEDGPTC
jgi:uncharacterized protein YkwD